MMRVLHVVHQYPPEEVGGTELYTQTLARRQASRYGHEVAVFFPSHQPPAAPGQRNAAAWLRNDDSGVRVYAVPLGPRSRTDVFLSTFRQQEARAAFATVLAAEKPDVIHVQHLMGLPAGLIDELERAAIPFVVTLHDYWFPCANAQLVTNYDNSICAGPSLWLNCARCALARAGHGNAIWLTPALAPLLAWRSRQLRGVLARAARIIAPTEFVHQTYADLGMPAHNIVVEPHGLEVPSWVQERALGYRLPREGPLHVVYVGSIAWQKGVHVLIDAINAMAPEAVRLSIYGNLEKYPAYVAQLRAAARHPGIRFHGSIAREHLWRVLSEEADVVVVPSVWYETASLVTQEAFAAGVPVVASQLGALSERVTDGADGLHFPPGDADALRQQLRRLHDEPELLAQLRAGIQPVRLLADYVAAVEMIYREVAG